MAVRKYKYDGKEYDLDALKKSALSNWQGSDKDYRAMVEILQHMTDDEGSYADLDKINFGTNYATEKGMFGKNRENSKHYKRAVGYLLKQFQGMSPYEEPVVEAPAKTKASRQWLGSTVLNHLGDVSGYTTDEIRGKELLRALQATQNQLKTGDYDYEDQYGNEVLNGWLNDAMGALKTTDNLDDDNIFWGRVGLSNPFTIKKNPEQKEEQNNRFDYQYYNALVKSGLLSDDEYNSIYLPKIKEKLLGGISKDLGIEQKTNYSLDDFDKYFGDWGNSYWKDYADVEITKLVEQDKLEGLKPITHSYNGKKKKYIMVDKNDQWVYAYDPEAQGDNKMTVIPITQKTAIQGFKKGGELLKNLRNIYAFNT